MAGGDGGQSTDRRSPCEAPLVILRAPSSSYICEAPQGSMLLSVVCAEALLK